MRMAKIITIALFGISLFLISGCDELKNLKIQNSMQRQRISDLESELQAAKLQLDQCKRQLEDLLGTSGVELSSLRKQIAALEEDIAKKKALIESLQQQVGGIKLPAELNTMLEDFARANPELVSYDANKGVLKFKSDLLFEKGSDIVAQQAAESVKTLCGIMNSDLGKQFDIIIAGHTDDIPILKPETKNLHPTNWHLSSHRAISVLNVMTGSGVESERLSARGFGEFRPVAPNQGNKQGNPQNRRVEIYIVNKGT